MDFSSVIAENRREVQRVTLWGMALNFLLAVGKFLVGVIGASQALVADGVHSLSDMATDIVVIVGAPFWSAPADADHPHGHGRIETLITFFIGAALAAVGVGLAYRALSTLPAIHGEPPSWLAFAVACISIGSKEGLYQWTARVGKRVKSSAVIANAWHHRSDGISSLPVAVAVLGTKLRPEWGFLDHVATVIVSVFILQAAWKIVLPAVHQLLDAGASEEELDRLKRVVMATEGVVSTHAMRTRHIGPGLQVDLHIQVDPELTVRQGHNIAGAVKRRLLDEGPDVVDVLVHIEPQEGEIGRGLDTTTK
jgi:cation diffusion facilitator family transporter